MTLEYAYLDWCLAQIARKLGKDDDHALFMDRSTNYRHLWDERTGWMRPREMDGSWMEDFAPVAEKDQFSARGFCEANSAIYTYYVPHDITALAGLFGGPEVLVDRLNESFEKQSRNWQGADDKNHAVNWVDYANQPSTGMAHLFNKAGAPWLSQKWVRTVKQRYADTDPYGGYHGDEDQGQMGALGVLMAIGLFSVDGAAGWEPRYEITTPIFEEVTIRLHPDYYPGNTFSIRALGKPGEHPYIQSATLNDSVWESVVIPHRLIREGGQLELRVGPDPNKAWGLQSPE